MTLETNRRNFLRGALATSAVLMAARTRTLATAFNAERRFAPVKVARDRVIREVVGLRPYRAEGFVVDAQRAGAKLLVHNYGHGGAGITLSWGTASLAVDLARDFLQTNTGPGPITIGSRRQRTMKTRNAPRHFAVLGCGVNGLSTARTLQRRFDGTVTIYAKDLPPDTTSNIAGGFWSPTSVYDPEAITAKFSEQFRLACRISNRAFQLLAGTEYGVRWLETFELYRHEGSLTRELPGGNDLYPQQEVHRDPDRYFGFPYVKQYNTMLIEPSIYLGALLRDFYVAGGKVVVKEFRSREEIMRLPEQVIFNCTGLGARALFDDQKLGPVRGQLEILLPQPEIDYCYLGTGYMFPRRDGIVLGGTFDHDDWSLTPNAEQGNYILESHAEIMKGLKAEAPA
ncbi:MAG TPA: FAD-dependent oxidoreductase [Pyrinomonadaceae bacterium]|jgi:glycine/D-amino acid oxidase-like deaminating enzyme|nr:FAD-dependent oxidoreductase [Pyrinomonadaceae bacterium]